MNLKMKGAEYLSDALKSDNCKLIKLDISHNELKDEGAKRLSDAKRNVNRELEVWGH